MADGFLPLDAAEGHRRLPVRTDLKALMTLEFADHRPEFLVERMIVNGRATGIVAQRGVGKSLLALEMACALATGREVLGQAAADHPMQAVYMDYEMVPEDLSRRLATLGYVPGHPAFDLLDMNLHYYQLPDIPDLDTKAGGDMLERIINEHDCELIIIDTLSRVVSGAENDARPFLDLYRHSEMMIRRRGVSLIRLDHLGKDTVKGSRGSSAKEDSLDVVWQLKPKPSSDDTWNLKRTKDRTGYLAKSLTIIRDDTLEGMRHRIADESVQEWIPELCDLLDGLGVPRVAGVNKVQAALQAAGRGRRREDLTSLVEYRQKTAE